MQTQKKTYQGLSNFVGGKIEADEHGIDAAYRELREETAIQRADIELTHLMDFTYYLDDCYVEVYAGRLKKAVVVSGEENELYWSDLESDFYDRDQYAGDGNVGHILKKIERSRDRLLK